MMTYLLLRNNKESGPYSLDGLLEAGLTPNDLVWVEGQSVCWLRPSEIQELKSLAAANGKQTPVPIKKAIAPVENVMVDMEKTPVSIPVAEKKTIPGNGEYSAYLPIPETEATTSSIPSSANAKEEKAVPETKYARPLDELKELYAKDLENRLKKKRFTLQIPPVVRKAGVYIVFLAAGLIAGILIRNSGKGKNKETSKVSPAQPEAPAENPETVKEETVYIPETIIPEKSVPEPIRDETADPINEIQPVT